jgi:uncharacterized protein DUF3106
MAEYLAGAALAIALVIPFPCRAQNNSHAAQPKPQATPAPRAQVARPPEEPPFQRGHAGDWLRRYKDLPPDEQERALQNDPAFRRLPPARQQFLLQRLQHFSGLSPDEQLRMLNRMETWEHLTREQKQEARQIFRQIRQLPPDRQVVVHKAIDELRAMPPDQREAEINSDHFKNTFSDQERDVIREVTRLPLAPPEGGESSPQE